MASPGLEPGGAIPVSGCCAGSCDEPEKDPGHIPHFVLKVPTMKWRRRIPSNLSNLSNLSNQPT